MRIRAAGRSTPRAGRRRAVRAGARPAQRLGAADPALAKPRSRRGWRSERWPLRDGRMILIPGISPMGFRLPLDRLPELAPEDWPHVYPLDPFAARTALPQRAMVFQPRTAQPGSRRRGRILPVRTALTVELREGHLHVFLPPTESAEDFCALVEAIEDAARALALPLRVEGYPPPADARIDCDQGHTRPRRDRGQHPPRAQLARADRDHRSAVRGGAARPALGREIHAGRAPHRHRRRQSHRGRRPERRPTARSCAGPICWPA